MTAATAAVDDLLHGVPGLLALTADPDLALGLTARLDQLDAYAAEVDGALTSSALDADALETASAETILRNWR